MVSLTIDRMTALVVIMLPITALMISDVSYGMEGGSALSHPRVRILDPNGEPIEGVTVLVLANGTYYSQTTSSSGWAVYEDFERETFPPGSTFTATKEGYRTVEWSQGDQIPPMVISRKDDTVLVILLIALTVLSVLILLALSFKGRPKKGRGS